MSRMMLVGALLVGLGATAAWAQEGVVLMVRPEGVVVDAGALGRLEPGARLEFVRPAAGRGVTGYGVVTSVRGARALVAPDQGSWVREGDVAVSCPAPDPQGYQQLQQTVEQLQATSLPPPLRGLADRLQWALATRAAMVQAGRCDTVAADQEIARLTEALQVAGNPGDPGSRGSSGRGPAGPWTGVPGQFPPGQGVSVSPGSGQSAYGQYPFAPPPTGAGPYPPVPGSAPQGPAAYPGQGPQDSWGQGQYPPGSYSPGPSPHAQGSPGPGPYAQSPPVPGQPATAGGDAIDTAGRLVDVFAKMAAVARGLGLAPTRRDVPGGPAAAGGDYPPPIGYPSAAGYPSPGSSAPPGGYSSQGAGYPPVAGGWSGSGQAEGYPGQGSPGTGPPFSGGYTPGGPGSGDPPGYPPTPGIGTTAPPGTGWPGAGSAPGTSPEGGRSGSGRGGFSLPGTPGKGATGTAPGGTGSGVATKSPGAAVASLAKRATVTGYVRSESGQAIAAALVTVSVTVAGTQVKTETRTDGTGAFTMAGLPTGPFVMTVSAPGYVNGTHTGSLDRGEVERVEVRLKRFGVLGVPGRW